MKIFWFKVLRRTTFLLVFSYLLFFGIKILAGVEITWPMIIGVSGGIWLSTAAVIGLTTYGMLWVFRRWAARQGVDIEDIVFALYELKWSPNRVGYDFGFKNDLRQFKKEKKNRKTNL